MKVLDTESGKTLDIEDPILVARRPENYSDVPCKECGKPYRYINVIPEYREHLLATQLCSTCDFWIEKIDDPQGLRIDGRHFRVSDGRMPMRGFGGTRHKIEKFDGTVIETRDLWGQGDIPARFRGRLPNNAKFLPLPERKPETCSNR